MSFVVVGSSYRTAPLALRERLAYAADRLPDALAELRQLPDLAEVMVLSTCNRVEVYGVSDDVNAAEQAIKRWIAQNRQIELAELLEATYAHGGSDALHHIFRVASSLDAMVVGEAQILGQVKTAYCSARDCNAVGPLLTRCMQRAFAVAKRVRTETEIARHPTSVSAVAVDLAGRVFDQLSTLAVLVIGAGEMAELAGRRLVSQGVSRLHVINRSVERAESLALDLGGRAIPLADLSDQLCWADVVISSTGSPEAIISRAMLADVMRQRKQRPLLIVDIAVPRDVEAEARSLPNVYLFDVDDLEQVVAANMKARAQEAKAAERLVAAEVEAFQQWLISQDVVPLIKQLRARFEETALEEARRTVRRLQLDGEQQEAIERLASAIVNKLLHRPTVELKRYASSPNGIQMTDAARKLFQLAPPSEVPALLDTLEDGAADDGGEGGVASSDAEDML